MLMQSLVVAVIVIACVIYASWTLMPKAARERVASVLLQRPLPDALAEFLRKQATAASGCACDGCDKAAGKSTTVAVAAATPAVQTIRFHPPRPRAKGTRT